jgi:tRNA 2-selenouridine synthase SelU
MLSCVGTVQDLLRLASEIGRLRSALDTAVDLEKEFEKRVRGMLAGKEPPVTPEDVEAFSKMIDEAKHRRPEEIRKLIVALVEFARLAETLIASE